MEEGVQNDTVTKVIINPDGKPFPEKIPDLFSLLYLIAFLIGLMCIRKIV